MKLLILRLLASRRLYIFQSSVVPMVDTHQNNSYHPLTFSILINVLSNLKFSVLDKCEILLRAKKYRNSTAPAAQKKLHNKRKPTNNA